MESKAKFSLSYVVFMYREQLHRSGTEPLRLNRTKLTLTDKLINKIAPHIDTCSMDDVRAVNRGLILRKKLKDQISKRLKKPAQKQSDKEQQQQDK